MTPGKCICQICTCGRHRCPHNRGSIGSQPVKAQCVLTEYQRAYETLPKQAPRKTIYPPVGNHTSSTPMQVSTIYKDTYVKHDHKSFKVAPKTEYVPPNKAMSLMSTYTHDYTGQVGKRPDNFKPDNQYRPSGAKFQNKTIYGVSYHGHSPEAWKLCRTSPIRHKESIEKNKDKFDATSTMKDDFKKHENPVKAELILPTKAEEKEPGQRGKFDGDTTYGLEYVEKKREPVASCKPKSEYKPDSVPLISTTTFMRDYQPHLYAKRQASFKPQSEYKPCKSQFESKSTASTAYQSWPVQKMQKPAWGQRKPYEKPQGAFVQSSSYQQDFQKPEGASCREQFIPQKNELLLGQSKSSAIDKFRCTTHYREQYIEYQDADRAKSFKVTQVYETPKEPVLSESIYQAKYTGEQSERAKPYIPSRERNNSSRQFMTFATTYKETYKGEQQLECPAKNLTDKDLMKMKNGHKMVKVSTTTKKQLPCAGDNMSGGQKPQGNQQQASQTSPSLDLLNSKGMARKEAGQETSKSSTSSVTQASSLDKNTQHPSITKLNEKIDAAKAEIQSRAASKNDNSSENMSSKHFCQTCFKKLGTRALAKSAITRRSKVVESTKKPITPQRY